MIHGTSEEADIGRPASHGCVRLRERDITELLSYIQNNIPNSQGTANITEYKKHTHASVRVDMRNPVAVHFVYRRAEPNGQRIVMYPDIYKEGDLMNEERLVTATQLVGRSGNLERTIHDLQPTMSAKSQQVLIPMVQGRKIEPQALEKYYLPAKLRFFVWYINDRGTVTAWSRLFSKTERAQ